MANILAGMQTIIPHPSPAAAATAYLDFSNYSWMGPYNPNVLCSCPLYLECIGCTQAVAPGSAVLELPESGRLRVGGGLHPDGEQLCASKAGTLRATKAGKLWVEGSQKRCTP